MEEKKWLDLLLYTDHLNRSVKEAGWNYADKEKVYSLKDSVVQTLLRAKPDGVNFELLSSIMFRISNIPAPQKTAPVLLCARTAANIRLNTTCRR